MSPRRILPDSDRHHPEISHCITPISQRPIRPAIAQQPSPDLGEAEPLCDVFLGVILNENHAPYGVPDLYPPGGETSPIQ